jgi:transposase-like protein
MVHCPNCGKEVEKPARELKNHSFTIQSYICEKCHHNFKVTINQSIYM